MMFSRRTYGKYGPLCIALWTAMTIGFSSAVMANTLSTPEVDAYNLRIGTQGFGSEYMFTTNHPLVENADGIRGMDSDVMKFYLGFQFATKYGVGLAAGVSNLTTLARDEPSCRYTLDLPFKHFFMWIYSFTPGAGTYWKNGVTATEQQKEYAEIYALVQYLLTAYNDSGKSFYLGHWEGDWHLLNNYDTSTNPDPVAIQGMQDWLNIRQQAVDDAMRDTVHTNVAVYHYTEVNRVRDAMVNGAQNNQRVINTVVPAVTNLDFVSWSSYDGQNLSVSDLYATLDYIEANMTTNKNAAITGKRVFVGEYGWGGSLSSEAQEPVTRTYMSRLISWGAPFSLFWQMYNNEAGKRYWLIDNSGQKTPCYYLHQRFYNAAKLRVGEFEQTNGRMPDDSEFAVLASAILSAPLAQPSPFKLTHLPVSVTNQAALLSGTLEQGIYGDTYATVRLFYGDSDGGTNTVNWQHEVELGTNTQFGIILYSTTVSNLVPSQSYYYRLQASNETAVGWAPATTAFGVGQYLVTFDEGAHGSRVGGGALTQMVDHAMAATEPIIAAAAKYEFVGWDSLAFTNVTTNLTITAQYRDAVVLAEGFDDGDFEVITGDGDRLSGYTFGAWEVGDSDKLGANGWTSGTHNDGLYTRANDATKASSGVDSLTLLSGRPSGEVFQMFETIPGQGYTVLFDVVDVQSGTSQSLRARVFDGQIPEVPSAGSGFRSSVDLADGSALGAFVVSDVTNAVYETQSFSFTAASSVSTLAFLAQDPAEKQIYLDNVVVIELPPPQGMVIVVR